MPKVICEKCEGTGWKPLETDGVRSVVRCECKLEQHSDELLARARIPRRYEHCALENYDIRKDPASGQANRSLAYAKSKAGQLVDEYPTDYGLLFIGPTGVGKTHLAVAAIRELMLRKGVECMFYDFRDLLKEIQDSYNPVSKSSEFRVLQPVLDVDVLLLDELAALNPSDWVKETLAHIINSRYNQKKVTLITTTLPFGESSFRQQVATPSGESVPDTAKSLNQYGVTLRSRLYEMCKVVEMQSDDYRKAIKQAAWRFHNS